MPKKAKSKKPAVKKAKKQHEETSEEHERKHAPDVRRLLQEYEEKEGDILEEEEFLTQHFGGKTPEEE